MLTQGRLASFFLIVAPLLAGAQNPARTIQLVPSELAGVVRDTADAPLRDVEIIIPLIGTSVRTDASGKFVLLGIIPGAHEVWFRRIGFASVQFDWTGLEGKRTELAVTLHRLPNTLDPVTVWANERRSLGSTSVISGVVVDSGGLPVANADLQLIGASRSTLSAADGSFEFRHVPNGTLTVRARHMGYSPSALSLEIEDNDQRTLTMRIRRLDQVLDTVHVTDASGYGSTDAAWREFEVREHWRSNNGSALIGPARLAQLGGMPLDCVLSPYSVTNPTQGVSAASRGGSGNWAIYGGQSGACTRGIPQSACILENGIKARHIPLSTYFASDVDRVEYYPAAPEEREYSGTIESRLRMYPQCAKRADGSHPPYFVVWLKSAR